jgi:hypothetical protein
MNAYNFALSSYLYNTKFNKAGGQIVATIEELGVTGRGLDETAALGSLCAEIEQYAKTYFLYPEIYIPDSWRSGHQPWLERFIKTPREWRVRMLQLDFEKLKNSIAIEDIFWPDRES